MKFEKQITSAVKRCFFSVDHVLFLTPDSSYQQSRKTCCLPIIPLLQNQHTPTTISRIRHWSTSSWQRPMRSSLQQQKIFYSRLRSLFFSPFALEATFIKSLLCFIKWELCFPLYNQVQFQFCFILTISPEECQMKSFGKKSFWFSLAFYLEIW